jgi:hypothetical protein
MKNTHDEASGCLSIIGITILACGIGLLFGTPFGFISLGITLILLSLIN